MRGSNTKGDFSMSIYSELCSAKNDGFDARSLVTYAMGYIRSTSGLSDTAKLTLLDTLEKAIDKMGESDRHVSEVMDKLWLGDR